MKGLLLKDFYTTKRTFFIFTVFLIVMQIFQFLRLSDISTLFAIQPLFILFGLINRDEVNKWDTYCICLPCSTKDIIKSKLIIVFIYNFIWTVINIILSVVCVMIFGSETSIMNWISEAVKYGITAIILSNICLPLMYKFGSSKGISIFLYIFFCLGLVLINAVLILKRHNITIKIDRIHMLLVYFTVAVISEISAFIFSVRCYKKREF